MIFAANSSAYFRTLWFSFLTLVGGVWAYYRIFTGFSVWDDEGSLMASVKQYLDGFKLYDQVWSGYGPVYYFYNWIVRSITGTPVTHNVVRLSSLLPWLLTSLVCAWIVLRLTDSLCLASLSHLATLSLGIFANEWAPPRDLYSFVSVSCRERDIGGTALAPCRDDSVGGIACCTAVNQGEYRSVRNPRVKPSSCFSRNRQSFLEDRRHLGRTSKSACAICLDEASAGGCCCARLLFPGDLLDSGHDHGFSLRP